MSTNEDAEGSEPPAPSSTDSTTPPFKKISVEGNDITFFLVAKMRDILLRSADSEAVLSFSRVNAAIRHIELNHDEQVTVMKLFEKMGIVRLIPYKGWQFVK